MVCDVTGDAWDVYSLRYTPGTAVIATGGTENLNANKLFLPEICSESINASMTYTGEGRNVKTVTDARGYVTTNEYDEKNDLLKAVIDAKGNRTEYTYDGQNDLLTEVSAKCGDQLIKNTYAYDSGDRLKSIGHNGFHYNYEYDEFGNQKSVGVGEQKLESYTYLPHNGPVASVLYGNGAKTEYTYDKKFRVTEQSWDGQVCFRNAYDDYDALLRHEDLVNGVTYHYSHDMIGRLTGMDTSHGQALRIAYDGKNRVESIQQKIDNTSITTKYQYGEAKNQQSPGLIYGLEVDQKKRLTYEYDKLGRVTGKTWNLDGNHTVGMHLDYVLGKTPGTTTTLVESLTHGAERLSYTYDELGNIRTISENGTLMVTYTYDEFSQLVREDRVRENQTVCYAYDGGGNLTARKEYAYTEADKQPTEVLDQKQYGYENPEWRDQLTSYNGEPIVYDGMGNPVSYRGMSMVWKKDRELSQVVKDGNTFTYSYDSEGIRVGKMVDGVSSRYYLNGSSIVAMKTGSEIIHFIYDPDGNLFSLRLNGKDYYYVYNVQNDITGLVDSCGVQVVSYQYDSWGNLLGMSDESEEKAGKKNPFRYRGYFWDEETGLYYLNVRYYDPTVGRFISADEIDSLDQNEEPVKGHNLFSYCHNNPANMSDVDGNLPKWATQLIIGTAVIAAAAVLTVATAGTGTALACFAAGALKGAVVGAAQGAVEGAVTHRIQTGSWKGAGKAALKSAAKGYMNGAITGFVSGGLSSKACFVAGTVVLTENGYQAIENIRVGDLVWAQNEKTGEKCLKRVVQTFVKETDELISVQVAEETILCTSTHPFYCPYKGWIRAGELKAGDILLLYSGVQVRVEWINKSSSGKSVRVYNFEVDDLHTYFVGNLSVLVHNSCGTKGRGGKQKRLRELSNDDKVSSQLRGEIKRDINQINRGKRKTIRVPSGYNLAHRIK